MRELRNQYSLSSMSWLAETGVSCQFNRIFERLTYFRLYVHLIKQIAFFSSISFVDSYIIYIAAGQAKFLAEWRLLTCADNLSLRGFFPHLSLQSFPAKSFNNFKNCWCFAVNANTPVYEPRSPIMILIIPTPLPNQLYF